LGKKAAVLIGDQVSAIHEREASHLSLLLPVADIALHTLRSAMGQNRPPALQKDRQDVDLKARHTAPTSIGYR
jgi:hypothetical protein